MASRFSVNKADATSVFISSDDVRVDGGSSSPSAAVDSPRLSTGSSGKPSSPSAGTNGRAAVAFDDTAAAGDRDDQPAGNIVLLVTIVVYTAYPIPADGGVRSRNYNPGSP